MKKFAFAAIALLGICLLIPGSPSAAKSGGGGGGFKSGSFKGAFRGKGWQPSFRRWQFANNRRHHHHHHNRNTLYGWGYGDANLSAPLGYIDPTNADDVTGSIPVPQRVAQPVIRSALESQHACSSEHVTVASSSGGETTVTVIRC